MGLIEKNGVPKFSAKLQIAGRDLPQRYADRVLKKAFDIATEKYGQDNDSVIIFAESGNNGEGRLLVDGEALFYKEFGTGVRGEGTYDNSKLPKQTFKFESPKTKNGVKGVPRKTEGWVYNYMKKLYHPEAPNWTGFPAKRQMLDTALELRRLYGKYIKE